MVPEAPELIDALIKEGNDLVTRAEAIAPTNTSVIKFRALVNLAKEATTPEVQRQALIQMDELEGEIRAITEAGIRDYWDKYLENNPLRTGYKDTDAGAYLALRLENAGDILREWYGNRDRGYIREKFDRIYKNLGERDWTDSISSGELARLKETRELIKGLPTTDETSILLKALLANVALRNVRVIKDILERLEPLLGLQSPTPIPKAETETFSSSDPLVLKQYPVGEVPEKIDLGGLEVPIPPARGTEPPPKKAEAREKLKEVELPRILTMEEYERDWKPKGWNIIFIGPTSSWRQEWGEWESIRDIVQNALDETEAYQWGYDDQGLWISDKGKGVAIVDFLLGPPKLKPDYARGKFGEGMKISALALVRAGYTVYCKTVGREIYVIFLEQKVNGRAQSLAALWRPDGTKSGTTFHIIGYTGDAYEDRFAVNLPRSAILFEAPSKITEPKQRFNQLIQASPARIYARDIYMMSINSVYSYNLWGFAMAPDRFAPRDMDDMWVDMGRLWACVNDVKLLEIFFQMMKEPPLFETDESRHLNMSSWTMGEEPVSGKRYADIMIENAEAWQKAWDNTVGKNAVIRTGDRWDGTVKHLDYVPVSLYYSVIEALSNVIKTDRALIEESQARLREVEVIPLEQLTPRQQACLELARLIADRWTVGGVQAAIIPPASDRVRTAGLYNRTTQEIFISAEQLQKGRDTVDTLIHELAHHTTDAEDGEKAHYEEISRLAGFITARAVELRYDKVLRLPDFAWY